MKANRYIMSRDQMQHVWQNANWQKVVEVFGLEIDQKRRGKPDEIWIKSPFTNEANASLHLNIEKNIFKDFSSGKGAQKGILNFCQELLRQQGSVLNCYEVAEWMMTNGVSTAPIQNQRSNLDLNNVRLKLRGEKEKKGFISNKPISVNLLPHLRYKHPELDKRGISEATCQYLGCGYLPNRNFSHNQSSPLNGRIVFQVRGILEDQKRLKPTILTHTGRALTAEQEEMDGKYWSFPFHKGLEIYNQDKLLLDNEARCQLKEFGLILVEGFFDVASLVEAGCLNVGALMGSQISQEQITRLKFIDTHVEISRIKLFLDRDKAGHEGAQKAFSLIKNSGFQADIFNWNQTFFNSKVSRVKIPDKVKDAGDMSVKQLQWLRENDKI
jgi:DNA primase